MYKYENLDNFRRREHKVEVTIQSGEYKGKLTTTIGGNCFGLDILNCIDEDMIYDIDNFECIGCSVYLIGEDDDGNEWFKYFLEDEDGNTCEGEEECRYFSRLIVGINIVECTICED